MIFAVAAFMATLFLSAVLKVTLVKSRLSTNKERPMLLGVSIFLAFFVVAGYAFNYYKFDISVLSKIFICSFMILVLGVIDDINNLSVRLKLSGQILVAVAAVLLGLKTTIAYFPHWVNILITIIWIITIINAFNLLDIMDGLCTGVSFIIAIFFLLVSLVSETALQGAFFWALCGATLAAVVSNLPPARLYLGDSGSMLLGLIFSCSALNISYAPEFKHGLALFVPVFLLGLPIYDLALTIFIRKKKGIAIVNKSPDHMALILKRLNLSKGAVLAIIYGVCILSGTSALLLKAATPIFKSIIFLILVTLLTVMTIFLVKEAGASSSTKNNYAR